jgi:archaellum biogenesis ATPase FlaH
MTNQITISQILEHCEIDPKVATIVMESLNFFLQNNSDRRKFIEQYESQQLWRDPKETLKMMELAKNVGSYHHTYGSIEQLSNMPIKQALEKLFNEPINQAKIFRFNESGKTLDNFIQFKLNNPKKTFMTSLLYLTA